MEPRHSDNESDEEEAPPAAVAPTAPPPARRAKAAKTNPPCSVCGKVVAGNATHLKMHMNTHTGDRPHACAFEGCGKTFKQSSHLKVHEKMHERPPAAKKPPQQCGVCAKIVAGGPAHLQLHMNVHTGARPYKCNQCSKAFAQPGSLTYHVRRHHSGEKPHRCDVDGCGAAFVSSGELAGHKESHHSAAGAQRKKKQEQAMKNALVLAGYVESFERGRVPAPGEFTREVYFDHRCALARDFKPGEKQFAYVDFVVTSPDGRVVFLEVDEEQHGHHPQLCETTRMWNICQSIVLADLGGDINVFWLRVNPNVGFHVGGKTLRTAARAAPLRGAQVPRRPQVVARRPADAVSATPSTTASPTARRSCSKTPTSTPNVKARRESASPRAPRC